MNNKTNEHEQKRLIALRCLTHHDHTGKADSLTRENCDACVLNGYHPKGERKDFINYAGWARLYIQAGKVIPSNLQFAFLAELASSNRAYAEALKQDIREYGINAKGELFRNAIKEVLEIWD